MILNRRHRHFNPATAGAVLSLDARTITGLADGDAVETWSGRPGSTATVAQSTAGSRPVFKVSILNGNPVVRLDGTDDFFNVSGVTALPTALYCLLIFKRNTQPTGLYFFGGDDNSVVWFANDLYDAFGTTTRKHPGVSSALAIGSWILYEAYSAASDWRCFINGTQFYSTATNTVGGIGGSKLGNDQFGGTYMDGDIAAFVLAESVPSAALRRRIEQSLAFSFRIPCA